MIIGIDKSSGDRSYSAIVSAVVTEGSASADIITTNEINWPTVRDILVTLN
jgi:hypothetical protein